MAHDSIQAVRNAIVHRMNYDESMWEMLAKHGFDKLNDAINSAAEFHGAGGLDEIGSSDVSYYVDSVMRELGEPSIFAEVKA